MAEPIWMRIRRWLRLGPPVKPHPEMPTDRGERRHAEEEMEAQSQHAGRDRPEPR